MKLRYTRLAHWWFDRKIAFWYWLLRYAQAHLPLPAAPPSILPEYIPHQRASRARAQRHPRPARTAERRPV